jgi:hypothetical protein
MRHRIWFGELLELRKRAVRARVWFKVGLEYRATIDVLRWIVGREERELLEKIIRNRTLSDMFNSVANILMDKLSHRRTPFKERAFLRGSEISGKRIEVYRKNGVLGWAPWVEGWLKKMDSRIFLGLMSKGACDG